MFVDILNTLFLYVFYPFNRKIDSVHERIRILYSLGIQGNLFKGFSDEEYAKGQIDIIIKKMGIKNNDLKERDFIKFILNQKKLYLQLNKLEDEIFSLYEFHKYAWYQSSVHTKDFVVSKDSLFCSELADDPWYKEWDAYIKYEFLFSKSRDGTTNFSRREYKIECPTLMHTKDEKKFFYLCKKYHEIIMKNELILVFSG